MSSAPSATNTEKHGNPTRISSAMTPESLIRRALDEVALMIGSAAAFHQLDDDFVWTVMKRLDRVRVRSLRDLNGLSSTDQPWSAPSNLPRVHAAVGEFLVRNREGVGE